MTTTSTVAALRAAGGSVPSAVPHYSTFGTERLRAAKGERTVSVCLPARDEEATVGAIVSSVRAELQDRLGLVDEVLVLDHGSRDGTARVAAAAGAVVRDADDVLSEYGAALGKGDVLWRSVAATRGDVIVWLDADLTSFETHYVTGLLGPMLTDPSVAMVRATYERALDGVPGEGGRVTELVARPLLAVLAPALSHVRQPLGGEYAIRRDVAEAVSFEPDYGVEIGLLLDVAAREGVGAIAQVDLGERTHRNRPLADLREQSQQVLRAVLSRTTAPAVRGAVPLRPPLASLDDESLAV